MHSSIMKTYLVYEGRECERLTGNSNTGNEAPEHPRPMTAYPSNKLHPDHTGDRITQVQSLPESDRGEVGRISCQEKSQHMRVQPSVIIEEIL